MRGVPDDPVEGLGAGDHGRELRSGDARPTAAPVSGATSAAVDRGDDRGLATHPVIVRGGTGAGGDRRAGTAVLR
ncbi:hypothetical protein GCM10017712_34910 [Curtobacterium citreum]